LLPSFSPLAMNTDKFSPDSSPSDGSSSRRDFLRITALASGTLFTRITPAAAQSQTAQPSATPSPTPDPIGQMYRKLIPANKHLDPAWVASLTQRGTVERYVKSQNQLQYIGLPVGGIMCGTVYLGGDGKLWVWEIFNRQQIGVEPNQATYNGQIIDPGSGATYVNPLHQEASFQQGFALRLVKTGQSSDVRPLDTSGFAEIAFEGSYPMSQVTYTDPSCPVQVQLTSYSPFIPLDTTNSSLPVTILEYEVDNISQVPVQGDVFGWTENPVGLDISLAGVQFVKTNQFKKQNGYSALHCTGSVAPTSPPRNPPRPDIVFEDFEGTTYDGWTATGTAFGSGPTHTGQFPPSQQPVTGYHGNGLVDTYTLQGDLPTGTLTSPQFVISRDYISFLIGGGQNPGLTCLNLIVNGQQVFSATGRNVEQLIQQGFDVRQFAGQTAQLEIVDNASGGWGHINIDYIVFTDTPPPTPNWDSATDNGDLVLGILTAGTQSFTHNGIAVPGYPESQTSPGVGGSFKLAPGQKQRFVFFFSWYFPNLYVNGGLVGRHYQAQFTDALEVASYLSSQYLTLSANTKSWVTTWNDSTLPYWLLDRSISSLNTLATETCYRFASGRFWAWEGVCAGPGTCTHVWHYAQSMPRIFPELSRNLREVTDFLISQDKTTGGVAMRAENDRTVPTDGQCGIVLESWREHRMSADDTFLRTNWPSIKLAMQYLINQDIDGDGIIDGPQPVTEDAAWYGKISFITTMFLAALQASIQMASEVGDPAFAAVCQTEYAKGQASLETLFNGQFFIQILDPAFEDVVGTGPGCFTDQILGQWWAFHVGLGQIVDRQKAITALQSLWRFNYDPNIGPFRAYFTAGRPYAIGNEAALVMCTWPNGGYRPAWQTQWQSEYFNESWTGMEHAAAANMIYHGLLTEGLAIMRTVHDRYNPSSRNPFNEIEYSDHYSRAMSAYSVFLAVTGYDYHGPKGRLGFAPKLSPENFRAAFTAAEGWGTFSQVISSSSMTVAIQLAYGQLTLNAVVLEVPGNPGTAQAKLNGTFYPTQITRSGASQQVTIQFNQPVVIQAGQTFTINISV
jgi:non-lysosomal glucosylceramidase